MLLTRILVQDCRIVRYSHFNIASTAQITITLVILNYVWLDIAQTVRALTPTMCRLEGRWFESQPTLYFYHDTSSLRLTI